MSKAPSTNTSRVPLAKVLSTPKKGSGVNRTSKPNPKKPTKVGMPSGAKKVPKAMCQACSGTGEVPM